jgi:hypothetical protein
MHSYENIIVSRKRCDANCGLGQECQLINGEEMCVCSEESCKNEQQPLCASNNMTFSSECAMQAWKCIYQESGLYKRYDGQCQSMYLWTNGKYISSVVFF